MQSNPGQWAARLAGLGVVGIAAGPGLAHFEVVAPMAGFLIFAVGGLLGVLAFFGGLIALFRGGRAAAATGILLGVASAVLVLGPAVAARDAPPINDITTDLADPPEFRHAGELPGLEGEDLGYPDAFRPVVDEGYPDLDSRVLRTSPTKVFTVALEIARSTPRWEVTTVDADDRRFEGVAVTRLFRFRDDFVVRVRPEPGGAVVDMRSRSRDGRGDLGANAARIRGFLDELESRVRS